MGWRVSVFRDKQTVVEHPWWRKQLDFCTDFFTDENVYKTKEILNSGDSYKLNQSAFKYSTVQSGVVECIGKILHLMSSSCSCSTRYRNLYNVPLSREKKIHLKLHCKLVNGLNHFLEHIKISSRYQTFQESTNQIILRRLLKK